MLPYGDLERSQAQPLPGRPTLGLLIGLLDDPYQAAVWSGIVDAVQEAGGNLLCFVGQSLRTPYGYDAQANLIYDLASADTVDGLILMSGSLANFVGLEEMNRFCERFRPLPMVSVALELNGVPSVLVDNYRGMRDLVEHLIQVHGYTRLAFLRGPEGHPEAGDRFRAFVDTLSEHGLPLQDGLIAPGDFRQESGASAIEYLLRERRLSAEAIVSVNDAMAVGAAEALREHSLRVPYDVVLTGYDDTEDARFTTPPLTTVRQPLHAQGRRAVELLLAQLRGEPVPPRSVLPMDLVIRQSCGCYSAEMLQAAAGEVVPAGGGLEALLSLGRERVLAAMLATVPPEPGAQDPSWADRLLDALVADLSDPASAAFLPTLDSVLRRVVAEGGDVNLCQAMLSSLRQQTLPYLEEAAWRAHAEDLWQQGRVLIGEMNQRVQARLRLQAQRQAQELRRVGYSLSTTVRLDDLVERMAQELPRLGIRGGGICLYAEGGPEGRARPLLLWQEGRRREAGAAPFPCHQLLPGGLPQDAPRQMTVQPLYFRDTQIGFALLELGPRDGALHAALQEQISAALRGALLFQERERLVVGLEHRALQLQTAAEVARAVSSILEPDELAQRVVDLLAERFDLYYASLFLVEPDGEWLSIRAGTGAVGRQMAAEGARLRLGESSMIGWCVANRRPRLAADTRDDPMFLPSPLLPETRSEMALPLRIGERVIGALDVQSRSVNAFSPEHVTVFQAMADQLAVAMENARIVAEMRRVNQALEQTLRTQERLMDTIRALSTPVVPLLNGIILLPIVGHIDTQRSQQIMEQLLNGVQQHRARVAILDITGVALVDTSVANSLIQAAQAVNLLGAEVVLVGIRPEVAQTMVALGVDLSAMATRSNLQAGIEYALDRLGQEIILR